MLNFTPITGKILRIVGLDSNKVQQISELATNLDVSLTMDASSEIRFEAIDPDFEYAKANTWQIRRDVYYRELGFEISATEVSANRSFDPMYRISARNKNVQLMKRDKSPEAYTRISGTAFAAQVAERYGMNFFGEDTPAKQTIVKASNANNDESVWDVLRRAAGEQQFVCFETNNTLFFTSQEFLLGKWGDPTYQYEGKTFVPFGWPENNENLFPGSSNRWVLLDMPTLRKSDDDVMQAEGTMTVEKTNGVELRPGMTIYLYGIHGFTDYYLITSVEFEEGTPDGVRVSFRTPVPYEPRSSGGGGGASPDATVNALPALVVNKITEYVRRNIRKDTRNFNTTELITSPGAFNRAVEQTAEAIVDHAERVWNLRTLEAKDAKIEELASRYGRTSVHYLALLYVRENLRANIENRDATESAGETSAIRTINSRLNQFFIGRFGSGSANQDIFNTLYNAARRDALEVYRKTTRNQQAAQLNRFENKYGSSSLSFQALQHVEDLIVYRPSLEHLDGVLNVRWEWEG
jgi:hypothetical protein